MVEAFEHVILFHRRPEPLEKFVLGSVMHHPIGARDKQLDRKNNRLRIGHHALGGLVKTQQDVHRDGACDQRIGVIRLLAHRIMRQEF